MLNGIDPILIFTFYKSTAEIAALGLPSNEDLGLKRFSLPPVPIYLSEKLTGIYIDSEEKNVDIQTTSDGSGTSGTDPVVGQNPVGNVVTINMEANKDSLGITLLSALADQAAKKLVSKEYGITYLHGPITIFDGLLHSFSTSTESGTDKIKIKLEIALNSTRPAAAVEVTPINGTSLSNGAGNLTGGTLPGGGSFDAGGSIPVGNGALP